MASGNITSRTNLTVPTPTMLMYAGLSPFGVTDDRKITSNALFQEITKNITDATLGFGDGVGGTVSAANKGKIRYNNTTKTFQVSTDGGAYTDFVVSHIVQANNIVVDFGAQAGGVFDNTAIFATAIASCQSTGRSLFIPAGTYLGNITIPGYNSIKIFGEGPGRSIIQSATGASPVIFADNATGLTHSLTIEDLSLVGFGSGASDYGFRMSPDQPFDLILRNIRITNVAKSGVYIPTNAFTLLLESVDVSVLVGGLNGIDIFGDNTVTLIRCYVHAVGTNGAAYRLHSGRFTLLGCNLMDSGINADGIVAGDNIAEDGVVSFARVSLKGCNVEAFTNRGIRAKAGSQFNVEATNFVSPSSGTVTACLFDNMASTNPGVFDGLSGFALTGSASWTNGAPINSAGIPFLQEGVPNPTTYYDTNIAALVNIGYRYTALNGASTRATQFFNRLALGTGSNQGFDGNLNFIDDDSRTIGASTPAGRPQHIYVGTGGVHLGAGAVPFDGTNFALTGGTSPLLQFNDSTINSVVQSLTTVGMRIGTVSAHPLQVLCTNTAIWEFTAGGDLRVLTGSHTIGQAAGNRPTIAYLSTSVNVGIPGTGKGSIVFGNANNILTQTLEGADTPAATNRFKWPAADPTASQALTASAPVAGVVTLNWSTITAAGLTVGTSTIASGTSGRVLYDNAGVLGEYSITGTAGSVVMSNSPTLVTPTLGDATATSLVVNSTPSETNCQFKLFGRNFTGQVNPIPTLVPSSATANQSMAFDLFVKGTPTNEPNLGVCWIDITDTNTTRIVTDDYQTTRIGKNLNDYGYLSMAQGDGGIGNNNIGIPLKLQHLGGSVIVGSGAALLTTATFGYFYLAGMAGIPTGVPVTYTGSVALTVDTADSRLYGYFGGSWVNLTGSGGGITGTGTNNTLVKWNVAGTSVNDSSLSEAVAGVVINAGKETITGATISTDATGTVGGLTVGSTFTKNNSNSRTFDVARIKPTFNFGGSNLNTTVNLLSIDSTNTALTGVIFNLINAQFGGNVKWSVDSNGAITFASGVRQAFSPDTTTPGFNYGVISSDPSSLVDGDGWYNDATNLLKARVNGATVVLSNGATQQTGGAATAGGTYTATEQTMLQKAYDCLRTYGMLS